MTKTRNSTCHNNHRTTVALDPLFFAYIYTIETECTETELHVMHTHATYRMARFVNNFAALHFMYSVDCTLNIQREI